MITVPQAVEKVVKRSRYLSEALSKNLINISSLARYIEPEIVDMLLKPVSKASLIMAIKRLSVNKPIQQKYKQLLKTSPDMTVRSNLVLFYITNSESLSAKLADVSLMNKDGNFFNMTQGSSETSCIFSIAIEKKVNSILEGEKKLSEFRKLSAITLKLPKEAVTTPGIYYFFLKSLAWEEINLIEIISSYHEMTLIFEDKDINRAFMLLKALFPTP